MAIYGGQPPSDYYARQDARKDDKFRDIINLFLQLKQMKQGTEQQEWERGFKEKALDLDERQLQSLEDYRTRPQTYAPPEIKKTLEYMVESGLAPDITSAHRMYNERGYKPLERITAEEVARQSGRPPSETTERSDPVQTKNISYSTKVGSNIQREIDHLTKLLPTKEEWVKGEGDVPPSYVKTTGEETAEIGALEYAMSVQARLLGESQEGRLGKESLKLLTFIDSNIKNPEKLQNILMLVTERELTLEQAKKTYAEWKSDIK